MSRQMRLLNELAVVFALCLLIIAAFCFGCVRWIENSQTILQAVVGGAADAGGVTTLCVGLTGRDFATQRHLGLSDSQQHPLVVEGGLWFLAVLALLGVAVRVGFTTFHRQYRPDKEKEKIRQSPKKRKGQKGRI